MIWIILLIVFLPGFCFGLMFIPFFYDSPEEDLLYEIARNVLAFLFPFSMALILPIIGTISFICWIFGVH